jgi:hypothetical protein
MSLIIAAVLVVAFFATAVRTTADPTDGSARKARCCCPVPAAEKNDTTKE